MLLVQLAVLLLIHHKIITSWINGRFPGLIIQIETSAKMYTPFLIGCQFWRLFRRFCLRWSDSSWPKPNHNLRHQDALDLSAGDRNAMSLLNAYLPLLRYGCFTSYISFPRIINIVYLTFKNFLLVFFFNFNPQWNVLFSTRHFNAQQRHIKSLCYSSRFVKFISCSYLLIFC